MATNKMTTCKSCGAEIAKSAKICPYCGAKNKSKGVLGIIIAIVVIAIIIGIVSGGNGSSTPTKVDNTTSNTNTNQQDQPQQSVFSVGDKVELNNIIVTLVGVKENKGSTYNKPESGKIYVLCEFEIENNSSKEITVSSIMSFEAYCDDYSITESLGALMEKGSKNQLDGSIDAGKKMNGIIGYEVPKDWKELEIQFTPDFWSGKEIVFKATHK